MGRVSPLYKGGHYSLRSAIGQPFSKPLEGLKKLIKKVLARGVVAT
jgi:hypothetical protein